MTDVTREACAFCDRTIFEVVLMMKSKVSKVSICDECILALADIVIDEMGEET